MTLPEKKSILWLAILVLCI